jgi:hypothetical protein
MKCVSGLVDWGCDYEERLYAICMRYFSELHKCEMESWDVQCRGVIEEMWGGWECKHGRL